MKLFAKWKQLFEMLWYILMDRISCFFGCHMYSEWSEPFYSRILPDNERWEFRYCFNCAKTQERDREET